MSSSSWDTISWSPVSRTGSDLDQTPIVGWSKRRVPYEEGSTYLQTLDIWIPNSEGGSSPPEPVSSLSSRVGPWIVYIHGGAWRDPLVDSSSFERTAINLLHSAVSFGGPSIAGIASLNYRLSPHPNHPTHPTGPDASEESNAARTVKHPVHIQDVLTGLAYLQRLGAAKDYILAGHSCGATLAFQVAMDPSRWGLDVGVGCKKPNVIVGLNGLYDLLTFIEQPDTSHAKLGTLYEAFTRGAFGDDKGVWAAVCPTVVEDWKIEWPEGKHVVLVQSSEDTLVPYSQLQLMKERLESPAGASLTVDELPASRDHNDLWKQGDELLKILEQVASKW